MIDLIFNFNNEVILVRIEGNSIKFGNITYGAKLASIDGLRLSQKGVIKQFPDLKDRLDWKEEAINRFKEKIKSMSSEEEIATYIIADLRGHGYQAKLKQRAGFRPEKIR